MTTTKDRFDFMIAKKGLILNDLDVRGVLSQGGIPLWSTLDKNASVFHVDPGSGNDNNPGTQSEPFAATQTAIDACTTGNGDVIVRNPGTETLTETLALNKGGITVIAATHGINPLARGEYFAYLSDAGFTDGPIATVTARCTIIGLGFVSRDAGSTFFSGAAMLIGGLATASPFGVDIIGCRFPKWNVSNRIGIAIEGSSDCRILGCAFEGVGASFDSGIYVQGATQNLEIQENRFRQCTYAITHGAFAGGGPHGMYIRNFCEDAKLLEAGGFAATALVSDNFLETATDGVSYDDTVDNLNALGINFSGNHYAE